MGPEGWKQLAMVCAAGALGVFASLLAGLAVVPLCRDRMFVSRESKEGVASGRRDVVPMGGGFILLLGVTLVVVVFGAFRQIRAGYAACFLIAFWGFALLGFLDDYSKARRHGYGEKFKVILQVAVTMAFAVSFWWYAKNYVPESQLGLVTLPFLRDASFGVFYVPLTMIFLFYVSNAVNITDGFNGLAGGLGAIAAVAFTVITFIVGCYELGRAANLSTPLHQMLDTPIGQRMFALSLISAGVAGSCVGYLYFNWTRGCIYFGDTGSMALGAALAFLALFARAEFLMVVIGGVFFAEAGSVFLQRLCKTLTTRLADPLVHAYSEPPRPFVMAPLHHHFETIQTRELEVGGQVPAGAREVVRRRLTLAAWRWGTAFGVVGVIGQWGHYDDRDGVFNAACVLGVGMICALLALGVLTRLVYDCYFIGPDGRNGTLLVLYRGIPVRFGRWRLYKPYQPTDIPLDRLGYLERRTGLFRLFSNRVDARTAFGLLHFGIAQEAEGASRREHLRRALNFWEQVPLDRFRAAGRMEVLRHMAACYRDQDRIARAVDCLEELYAATEDSRAVEQIEALTAQALDGAEEAWARWQHSDGEAARAEALHGHEELLALMEARDKRAHRALDLLSSQGDATVGDSEAVRAQVHALADGMKLAAGRCELLRRAEPRPRVALGEGDGR